MPPSSYKNKNKNKHQSRRTPGGGGDQGSLGREPRRSRRLAVFCQRIFRSRVLSEVPSFSRFVTELPLFLRLAAESSPFPCVAIKSFLFLQRRRYAERVDKKVDKVNKSILFIYIEGRSIYREAGNIMGRGRRQTRYAACPCNTRKSVIEYMRARSTPSVKHVHICCPTYVCTAGKTEEMPCLATIHPLCAAR